MAYTSFTRGSSTFVLSLSGADMAPEIVILLTWQRADMASEIVILLISDN